MSKIDKVIWSPLANDTFVEIIDYLVEKWSEVEASDFYDKVRVLITNLKKNNHLCPTAKVNGYRKCVVNKQTSLVYRLNADCIELIVFLDNRANHRY